MLKTKRHVPARHTTVGYYNLHYPDSARAGFILPPETRLEALPWISNDGERAYLCHTSNGKIVAWIKHTDDISE